MSDSDVIAEALRGKDQSKKQVLSRRDLLKSSRLVLAGLVGSAAAVEAFRLPKVRGVEYDTANYSQFLDQGADPAAPPLGRTLLYPKAGLLYTRTPTTISEILTDAITHGSAQHDSTVPMTQEASYIIEKVGSTYYARPAPNIGLSPYSGADAATVINAALGAM